MIGRTNCTQKSGSPSEFVNIQLLTNQAEHSNLNGAVLTMSYETYSKQYTWDGKEITFSVPAHVSCTIEFPEVEGYKKPDNITFVAVEGNSRTIEAEYKAELVKVNVTSSNGSAVSGATLTINGKQQTWNGTEIRQLVPFGTQYSVVAGAVSGFGTPSTQTFTAQQTEREVSVLYVESSLVVNILSNQGTDSSISGVKATVSYGSSSVQVSNGQKIPLPTGVSVTISFPDVSSYRKPSNITFTHSGGVVTKSGTYECELLTVNVSADQGSVSGYRVTIASSSTTFGTQTTVTGTYKIPFGTSYTISTTSVNGYITPSAITRTASAKSYTAAVLYKINPVKDLSKFDIYGNAISQTTANCYVVNAAGTYKIPLVFGNALKNGSTNSAAYTKNSGSYSHDFVDYNGTVVTSPYIETVSGTAASAQLSIADTDGIFTNISIVNGSPCRYLQFKVNSVPATGANGILSIKNSSGVIMWSWHIWVWADSLATVEITNSTSVKYKILPVNLASKWDDDMVHIKNWFYQWGRPNPMLCPAAYNSGVNHANYGALSYAVASIASDIQTGIKNPATFYNYNSSYDCSWFQTNSDKIYNLWDAACTSTGNSDNDVVKTIYDPSPIGFKMPNGNTFTYFSESNVVGSFANGWKFKRYSGDTVGVFFPASGSRSGSYDSIDVPGSRGYVWLSSAYSKNRAYYFSFSPDYVLLLHDSGRAYGFSVRPVQE